MERWSSRRVGGPFYSDHMELWVPVIERFRGEHFFLSNFYPAVTPHRGRYFHTAEHAYAAAKTCDPDAVERICATEDPGEAKRYGQSAPLVDGWHARRFALMEEIVTAKFMHNTELGEQLMSTLGTELVEGNDWHDQTWGSCRCSEHQRVPGHNALGVILMAVRMRLAA